MRFFLLNLTPKAVADGARSANATLDATSDAFIYTPTEDWTFLSASGDASVSAGNDSVAVGTGSSGDVKVDLAFKGDSPPIDPFDHREIMLTSGY